MNRCSRKVAGPLRLLAGLLCCFAGLSGNAAFAAQYQHGLGYLAGMKYPAGFEHYDWVQPGAPKGGSIKMVALGTFDSLNPLIAKGRPAGGLAVIGPYNYLYDHLLETSIDEIDTKYGRLAEAVMVAEDFSWVQFKLRKEARFHDGVPITAQDVLFTFDLIKRHGSPIYKTLYRDIVAAEELNPHEIRFQISDRAPRNNLVPLMAGELYAMPSHYWKDRDPTVTYIEAPLGSGPYRVGKMVPGRYIEYERVPDYWGRDLPVNRGRWNFDLLGHDYFRDDNVMRESVKAGAVDWQVENVSKHWAQSYDFPALRNGLFVKDLIPYTPPMGLTVAFAFNLRLAKFQDIRVREALWRLRDFEWSNRVLFHGFYTRSHSFFTNTLNAARGLPSAAELELLEQFREKIPERVFTTSPQMPMTSGYGPNRRQLMMADELLQEAGWIVVDGRRVHADTGEVFSIDFLFNAPSDARVAMPYFEVLRRLGFVVTGVTAEVSRYRAQMHAFDYEATVRSIGNGHTPGPELRSKFGSAAADIEASDNWIGIKDEAVDYLIEKVVNARTQEEMTAAGRALDRVLVWSFYAIPGFRAPGARFVYWNKFGHPDIVGAYRINFPDAWWYDEDKAMLVDAGTTALSRQEAE